MAITGTGTQTDPWIVHNYSEIKDVLQNRLDSNTYAKLANDIDCNDYGDLWEWETITLRANWDFEFDLDGHTIKNIMIKNGNTLFHGKSNVNVIRNGKILNVFNNAGKSIIYGDGLTLKDISMSINGNGLTEKAFNYTTIENCAIYFKSSKLIDYFYYTNSSNPNLIKNSDFYFEIDNMNKKNLFHNVTFTQLADSCRFKGILKGASQSGYLFSNSGCINSVVEIDTTNMDWNSMANSLKFPCKKDSTGIINIEISPNIFGGTSGLTACTTAQMRDADYLNSIGFTVLKVGE